MPDKTTPSEPSLLNALITQDTLFDQRLICRQNREGYRFSVDAVLLAHFVAPAPGSKILDLGAGCGVISLILAYRHPELSITAFERQPALYARLCENIRANGFEHKISALKGDLRQTGELPPPETFDWVFCNPPYRKAGSGRINPGGEAATARHEQDTELDDVVAAIAYAVKNRGKAVFIYPAARCAGLIYALKSRRLEPKRVQPVYSYPGQSARLVLVEVVKNGGEELEVMAPFYIYENNKGRNYSSAMRALYAP